MSILKLYKELILDSYKKGEITVSRPMKDKYEKGITQQFELLCNASEKAAKDNPELLPKLTKSMIKLIQIDWVFN